MGCLGLRWLEGEAHHARGSCLAKVGLWGSYPGAEDGSCIIKRASTLEKASMSLLQSILAMFNIE